MPKVLLRGSCGKSVGVVEGGLFRGSAQGVRHHLARAGAPRTLQFSLCNVLVSTESSQTINMTSSSPPAYPPELSSKEEQYLLSNLKDWSIAHGLAVRPAPSFVSASQDPSSVLATTAPVTLFPSLFPRVCFEQGLEIQQAYNELYSAIARDEEWLRDIIEE